LELQEMNNDYITQHMSNTHVGAKSSWSRRLATPSRTNITRKKGKECRQKITLLNLVHS
jgi:hypothetical protein